MRTGLRTLGAEPKSIIDAPDTLAHWQQNSGSGRRPGARLTGAHAARRCVAQERQIETGDRKSTRLNSSHSQISYAVFCLKKKNKHNNMSHDTRYDH